MENKITISKKSKNVINRYGFYIIENDIKGNKNILLNFRGEDVVVEGNIETTGAITVIANTIRFEGIIKHNKGLTVFGIKMSTEKSLDGFLIR